MTERQKKVMGHILIIICVITLIYAVPPTSITSVIIGVVLGLILYYGLKFCVKTIIK